MQNKIDEAAGAVKAEAVNQTVSSTKYEQLTTIQKQRADYLKPMIGDHAVNVVNCLDSRGRNSWSQVYEKVQEAMRASYEQMHYLTILSENFTLGKTYTSSEIITVVSEVRQDLKMVPYLTNLKSNCERDFFSLFVAKDITLVTEVDGKTKKTLIGYKPVVCFKPEVEE